MTNPTHAVDAQPVSHVQLPLDGAQSVATSTNSVPSVVARLDGLTTSMMGFCTMPGCSKPADFDPNTGAEYPYCQDHSGVDWTVLAHQLLAQEGDSQLANIGGEAHVHVYAL